MKNREFNSKTTEPLSRLACAMLLLEAAKDALPSDDLVYLRIREFLEKDGCESADRDAIRTYQSELRRIAALEDASYREAWHKWEADRKKKAYWRHDAIQQCLNLLNQIVLAGWR